MQSSPSQVLPPPLLPEPHVGVLPRHLEHREQELAGLGEDRAEARHLEGLDDQSGAVGSATGGEQSVPP